MKLALNSVSYTYGPGTSFEIAAVRDVSIEVSRGELVLLMGATGSGKSTLLRIAAGLLAPTTGTATIDGVRLNSSSARGSVGLVFQDPESQLFDDTVLGDCAFGPKNLGAGQAEALNRAREAMAAVGLDPELFGSRSPFSLSGGEARRAAIAGVLAMRPGYLLADEPTAGLDAAGRRGIMRLLCEARERAGVVVVSHSAEEFLGEADRVLVLSEGRLATSVPAEEMISAPGLFEAVGLRAPDVLRAQMLAVGDDIDYAYSLDPSGAAASLMERGGERS